ncbi:ABC transporter permease [Endozoicomonas sp. SCSIO W0465]|uniref:ABC transporter permease n=1 Tax=Endozoicomonas sp. SCSIO W0465 TaxID=2918516 RepID=UPI0020759055|nr:ABC transporter permease [Endozoicomonas sp. SCSIO W0465]USE34749.1 ABC transporter permease [Endozoicomonas sp. SCSIO W0465]
MNQATLTVDKVSEPNVANVVITLQGSWAASGVLPALDQVAALLDFGQLKTVAFVTGDDFSWDSRLLAWLLACQRMLESSHCQFDLSGLPEDVGDLFRLANTVPPNKALPARHPSLYHHLVNRVARLGDEAMELLVFTGELALTLFRWFSRKGSARWSDIINFCYQSGPSALPIITLQSVLIGMILAYLGMVQLRQFGAEVYVSNLVGVGMVREMGALMTAVIMSGRTGAAYAAQLGTMQVNEEIDALTTLGIKPMDYLVLPRTLALILTIPLLCLYSNILGMFGGGLVATSMEVTWLMYLYQLRDAISIGDIMTGVFKSFVFAVLIAMAGCRAGLACGRSSAAVGQATTNAVVTAIIYLVVADAGLNILFYHLGV